MVKFAHLADVHLGAFRESELRAFNLKAFELAVDESLRANVDFIVIAGDLFHTSLPEMSVVDAAVKKLKEARDAGKRVYVVFGSHDYSPTETSIINVLESAGVIRKIAAGEYGEDGRLRLRAFKDEETGCTLVGMSARARGLEEKYFHELDSSGLEAISGPKVFVFHSTLLDYKPDFLRQVAGGVPLSCLPKGFDYYAAGHVHERIEAREQGRGPIVFPGPLWAADFRDLEELSKKKSGFYLVELQEGKAETHFVELSVVDVVLKEFDANGASASEAEDGLRKAVEEVDATGKIVLLKVKGELSAGKPGDIKFQLLRERLVEKGAVVVYLNRNALTAREALELNIKGSHKHEIEEKVLKEFTANTEEPAEFKDEAGFQVALKLFDALKAEKLEGEVKKDFEDKIARQGARELKVELL